MDFITKHFHTIIGALSGLYIVIILFFLDFKLGILEELTILSFLFSLGTTSVDIFLPKNVYFGPFGLVLIFLLFSLPYILIGGFIGHFVGKIKKKKSK